MAEYSAVVYALAVAVAVAAALAGYLVASRARIRTLEAELERSAGERHEAFVVALRLADSAGAHSAAEYVLHSRAASAEDLADAHMDELEQERQEQEELENDPLFQHLEDLADFEPALMLEPEPDPVA